ncbi:Hint domain-containing protein [Nioella aestuarii]|uniref:Hint domain-containing protein n=1 Tax=Nioella aestuarii TaxID=1662864 RepID=UPI003D7F7CA8
MLAIFFTLNNTQDGCTFSGLTGGGDGGSSSVLALGNTFTEAADAAASTSTTASMEVGDYYHGSISGGGDISDWIAVELTAGQEYTIALAGTGALTDNLRDPLLTIRDSGGTSIQTNDDISSPNGYYYSTVTFTAGSTGTYYIDVQSSANLFDGDYGVSVVEGDTASYDAQMGAGMLLSPNASWSTSPGTGATVTWAIRDTLVDDPANPGNNTSAAVSASQVAAITDAMDYIESITGLTLTQVDDGSGTSDNATILFGAYNFSDGRGAYAFYPDNWGDGSPDTASGDTSGDVWLNKAGGMDGSYAFGNFAHFALMHELGHALGLAHPGPYNAGGGGSITYANNAEFMQDSHQYTIMSYFDETNTGASAGLGFSDTFMLFDYLALHQLYGADTSFHAGATTYGFNSTLASTAYDFTANTTPFLTIYDGGGTDTIDLSGYSSAQTLNLTEGTFSDIGGFVGNMSIAYGAVIENAIGGSGDDTITGNSAANTITGGAGADTINAGDGDDTINALIGADEVNITATAGSSITANGNALATLNIHDPAATILNPTTIQTANGATITHSGFGSVQIVCFAEGSLISTPDGETPVEQLQAGDLVVTLEGDHARVKWMGRQTVVTRFGPAERLMPVRFAAGSLGDGLPHTDLTVTADHGMLVDGVICHAGALVNGTTITQVPLAEMGETYTVYHIETEEHEIILANGAPAETFIDNVSRRVFDNYAEFEALFGEVPEMEELPYPRAMSARQVPEWVQKKLVHPKVA